MDVRIVSNSDNVNYSPIYGEFVLQSSDDVYTLGKFISKKYYIFNIGLNERYEVLSSIKKYDFIKIVNCDMDSKYLYITSCNESKQQKKTAHVDIIRYNIVNGKYEIIFSFDDEYEQYYSDKETVFYVLDENYMIGQMTYITADENDPELCYVEVKVKLIDIRNQKADYITDDIIGKFGIGTIIPVKGKTCLIKTGFSHLIDNQNRMIGNKEKPIEILAFINTNQLISDLMLNKSKIEYEQIEKFNTNVTYPYVERFDDYITYSKCDLREHFETIVYYNLKDKHVNTYIHPSVYRKTDLLKTYMIDDNLYTLKKSENQFSLVNVKDDTDYSEYKDMVLKGIIHGILITQRTIPKSLLRKSYNVVELYKNLSNTPVISEKGTLVKCLSTDRDNIFIFTTGRNPNE